MHSLFNKNLIVPNFRLWVKLFCRFIYPILVRVTQMLMLLTCEIYFKFQKENKHREKNKNTKRYVNFSVSISNLITEVHSKLKI